MIKAFRKYFLTLVVILLYGSLQANPGNDYEQYVKVKISGKAEHNISGAFVISPTWVNRNALIVHTEIAGFYSEKNEEESDELIFQKAYTEHGYDFTLLSWQATAGTCCQTKKCLTSFVHWFYSSSHRCNILQVYRL